MWTYFLILYILGLIIDWYYIYIFYYHPKGMLYNYRQYLNKYEIIFTFIPILNLIIGIFVWLCYYPYIDKDSYYLINKIFKR